MARQVGEWDSGFDEGKHDAYLAIWIEATRQIAYETSYGFSDVLGHVANIALDLSREPSVSAAERRWYSKIVKDVRALSKQEPK